MWRSECRGREKSEEPGERILCVAAPLFHSYSHVPQAIAVATTDLVFIDVLTFCSFGCIFLFFFFYSFNPPQKDSIFQI